MTAIINCRHSAIKGGIKKIQQCRGKRKTEGKPRTELSMKNTAGRVIQTRNPEENLCQFSAFHHSPDLQSSLQGSLILCSTTQGGMAGLHHQQNPCQMPELHHQTGKGFVMWFALIVLIITHLKYQWVFEKYLSEIPLISWFFRNPILTCTKMAHPSFTQNLLSHS